MMATTVSGVRTDTLVAQSRTVPPMAPRLMPVDCECWPKRLASTGRETARKDVTLARSVVMQPCNEVLLLRGRFLRLRHLQVGQVLDNRLAGLGRLAALVDRCNLSLRIDIEGPARGELPFGRTIRRNHAVCVR